MVVAASTRDRLSEKCASNPIDLVVDDIGVQLPFDIVLQRPGANRQVSRGNDLLTLLLDTVVGEQVTRDLLVDKAVEWFIGIECLDHIVPVAPGITDQDVSVNIGQIGVAREIKPVAGPVVSEGDRV